MSRCFEGRTTRYLSSNLWAETVTHLHEQSPSPVSGKTTRDITLTNARGEILEEKTEAYIDGIWYTISRNRMTYNQEGRRTSLENLACQVTTTAWDCCHKVSETYPVRYTYDIFGNKTTMTTYRDETSRTGGSPVQGDVTTWLYDSVSGAMTNKVYADGKDPSYNYTPSGKLSRRTWARGIVTDYSYDNWGSITNTVYSDNTPTVSLAYDAFGRQISARDAAGVTAFLYDSFGSLTNETVVGVAGTNSIDRFYDNFGRDTGYAKRCPIEDINDALIIAMELYYGE